MGTQKVSFFAFATLRAVDFGDLKAAPRLTHTHTQAHTRSLANEERISAERLSNSLSFCAMKSRRTCFAET